MKLIASEWETYLLNVMPKNASVLQVIETKKSFYAGAGCLFYAILGFLEPGEDATDGDLAKMSALQNELEEFLEIENENSPTQTSP